MIFSRSFHCSGRDHTKRVKQIIMSPMTDKVPGSVFGWP